MKAIGYIRVSTEEQAGSGLSLGNQREKIEALASLRDMELLEVIEDAGFSAGSMNRPGLQEVLRLVRARKVDALLILKLDRLTRSQRDLLDLLATCERYGVALVSVTEQLDTQSATGRFFVGMMGLIAEWERGVIGERTSSALGQLKREGRRFSRFAPYGFRFGEDGELIEDTQEQATLALIGDLCAEGLSLRKIGEELLKRGYSPRNGKAWSPKLIARLKKEAA
jgi:DNA invertase Pin-like site-specific DNA recombinase